MAYKKINVAKAPKRTRKSVYRFELTPDWKMMKADLDRGLKPGEACQVFFTEADKVKYNIHNRRSIARFIQKYIRERELPYTVKSFERREAGGDFYVLVLYPPPETKSR
jgi:hypothetical protein